MSNTEYEVLFDRTIWTKYMYTIHDVRTLYVQSHYLIYNLRKFRGDWRLWLPFALYSIFSITIFFFYVCPFIIIMHSVWKVFVDIWSNLICDIEMPRQQPIYSAFSILDLTTRGPSTWTHSFVIFVTLLKQNFLNLYAHVCFGCNVLLSIETLVDRRPLFYMYFIWNKSILFRIDLPFKLECVCILISVFHLIFFSFFVNVPAIRNAFTAFFMKFFFYIVVLICRSVRRITFTTTTY